MDLSTKLINRDGGIIKVKSKEIKVRKFMTVIITNLRKLVSKTAIGISRIKRGRSNPHKSQDISRSLMG